MNFREQTKKIITKLQGEQKLSVLDRARQKYDHLWSLEGFIEPSKRVDDKMVSMGHKCSYHDKDGKLVTEKVLVEVRRFVGYNQGKYTGEKLRQIRAEQTKKAIAGQTHYKDGTPILTSNLIDLVGV